MTSTIRLYDKDGNFKQRATTNRHHRLTQTRLAAYNEEGLYLAEQFNTTRTKLLREYEMSTKVKLYSASGVFVKTVNAFTDKFAELAVLNRDGLYARSQFNKDRTKVITSYANMKKIEQEGIVDPFGKFNKDPLHFEGDFKKPESQTGRLA